MNKTGIILQARMGSTRLPEKMLVPFNEGNGLLQILISRIIKTFGKSNLILATTTNIKDEQIQKIGLEAGIKVFRGSEKNVLRRFIDAAEANGVSKIIRVCCDNPFLQMDSIEEVFRVLNDSDVDYVSFKLKGKPTILTHFGFWVEGVSLSALKRVSRSTKNILYQEHVTNYIHSGASDSFSIHWIPVDSFGIFESGSIRLTMDTEQDFNIQKRIYSDLWKGNEIDIQPSKIWEYLQTNTSLLELMSLEIEANTK